MAVEATFTPGIDEEVVLKDGANSKAVQAVVLVSPLGIPYAASGGGGGGGGGDASAANQVLQIAGIDSLYAEIVDQPDAATTYICHAAPGTAASAAAWRVRRIVVSGTTTVTTWAGGGAFNQIAANRVSLTYA